MDDKVQCLRGLEVKLTALPDNTACNLIEDKYGCEIVVRPDTIFYMTPSMILSLGKNRVFLNKVLLPLKKISNWSDATNKVENFNGFSGWFGFGNKEYIIASNDLDEQIKAVKCNLLIANWSPSGGVA